MKCHVHPEVEATARCAACAEACCEDCFITVAGQTYCAVCKTSAIDPLAAPRVGRCEEAYSAIKYALFGLVLFGFIVSPIAVFKGAEARRRIRQDPSLAGKGVADAAVLVGVCGFLLSCLGMASKVLKR